MKKQQRKPIPCIVKSSSVIRNSLRERLDELELSLHGISKDAKERGRPIAVSSLSRYFNHGAYVKSSLSQESILWLCIRYGIDIGLHIKKPDYEETKAISKLKRIFNGG